MRVFSLMSLSSVKDSSTYSCNAFKSPGLGKSGLYLWFSTLYTYEAGTILLQPVKLKSPLPDMFADVFDDTGRRRPGGIQGNDPAFLIEKQETGNSVDVVLPAQG